jgi:hypothetical protein
MSTAAKKQKNREYYLKNREKILSRARERNSSRRRDHLEIVPDLKTDDASSDNSSGNPPGNPEPITVDGALVLHDVAYAVSSSGDNSFIFRSMSSQMEQKLRLADCMDLNREPSDSENEEENPSVRKKEYLFSRTPFSFVPRLFLVVCLTLLMTAMQVEFYREHDILPGYAVPLALASEVAFLSLVTVKFRPPLEWLRILVHLIFFGYFVSALSFHVYAKSQTKAAFQPVVTNTELTEIRDQLKQAERSLQVATSGRAWKNMEILGAEVSRLRRMSNELSSADVLGTSPQQTIWIEAILLVLVRALLLATSALNVLRLRDQIYEMTHSDEFTMRKV